MKRSFAASPETWLFLALGGVAVALWPGTGAPAAPALLVVLALAVAVTGLPHGALDPWLARQSGLWRTGRGLVVFHLAYVALAALVLVAWRWAPGTSLALFLAISAWHFAGDWRGHLPGWARALAGAALLALPAWRWPGEVRAVFVMLSGAEGAAVAGALATMAPWLAVGMAVAAAFALRRSLATAVELAAIATLALLLPPLAYFIVYFCALHSLRHLRHAALGADAGARRRMAAVALAYTLLTLALAALAWPWLAGAGEGLPAPGTPLAQLVFIGLAALTLPHMLVVMHAERRSGALP